MQQPESKKHFLFAAGGTGGHIYPALSVAKSSIAAGHKVSWIGTEKGLESTIVRDANIDLHCISVSGIRGKGVSTLIKAPLIILKAIRESMSVLKKVQPDVVLGFGGYSAGPAGIAAKLMSKPLIIHEQNAIAGTTNKLLAPMANRVFSGFKTTLKHAQVIGNPLRQDLTKSTVKEAPDSTNKLKLLVLGGSLGAQFLNQNIPSAIALLNEAKRPDIIHQCGNKMLQQAQQQYQQAKVKAEVTAYIEDMKACYEWADLVVARAGAMTVSELSAMGCAALLVPFPHAIDDHQTENAKHLVIAGAAEIYQQSEAPERSISDLLHNLLNNPDKLRDMSSNALSCAQIDASAIMLSAAEELAHAV